MLYLIVALATARIKIDSDSIKTVSGNKFVNFHRILLNDRMTNFFLTKWNIYFAILVQKKIAI